MMEVTLPTTNEVVDDLYFEEYRDLELCLDFITYYEGGFLNDQEGILHFYEHSAEVIGDDIAYYLVDGESHSPSSPSNREQPLEASHLVTVIGRRTS